MSRYDEHGPVEEVEREYGPEWWALDGELCQCHHRLSTHVELVDGSTSGGTRFACALCPCRDFMPPLDNQ